MTQALSLSPMLSASPLSTSSADAAKPPNSPGGGDDFANIMNSRLKPAAKDAPAAEKLAGKPASPQKPSPPPSSASPREEAATAKEAKEAAPADASPTVEEGGDAQAQIDGSTMPFPWPMSAPVVPAADSPAKDVAVAPVAADPVRHPLPERSAEFIDAAPSDTGQDPGDPGVTTDDIAKAPSLRSEERPAAPAAHHDPAIAAAGNRPSGINEPSLASAQTYAHAHDLATHAGRQEATTTRLPLISPPGTVAWGQEVGQKIVLMSHGSIGRAELTLTPPHLGRIEVSLSVNGNETQANFVSASPAARDALEQALPRLREMLAEAGISLGQASVDAQASGRDENADGFRSTARPAEFGTHERDATATDSAPLWQRHDAGLINTYV